MDVINGCIRFLNNSENILFLSIIIISITFSCKKAEHAERLHELASDSYGGVSAELINGYANTIVAASREKGVVLYIYEYDPSQNKQLINKQELNLNLPDFYIRCVSIELDTVQMVVAATEFSGSDDGVIAILRREIDDYFHLKTTYNIPYIPKLSSLNNNVLFVCSSDSLYLYDIGSMTQLQLLGRQKLEYSVRSAYSCEDGFFFTTDVGFGVADISDWDDVNIVYSINEQLSNCPEGIKYDNFIFMGGTHNEEFIKILKVDVSDPFNPLVEKSKQDITGPLKVFTYDKYGNYFAFSEGSVFKYKEDNDGFKLIGYDQPYYDWSNSFYSIDNHIYGSSGNGITYYLFE